jgi:hypothetical protein
MTLPIHDVFGFWEADLTGVQAPQPATSGALALAMELQTADWTEEEAGAELARRCDSDSLHTAQQTLVEAFQMRPMRFVKRSDLISGCPTQTTGMPLPDSI